MRLTFPRIQYYIYSLAATVCLLLCLAACKDKAVDEGILPPEKMEDLLFDYHVAQAMAAQSTDSTDYKTRLYCAAVYNKYGITEQDFDHNMEWYTRHSDRLYKIYKNLEERMAAATQSAPLLGQGTAALGDTLTLWNGGFCLLSSNGKKRVEFAVGQMDSLREGDRIQLRFSTRWAYPEGARIAFAQICLHCAGDSVRTVTQQISLSGQQSVSIAVNGQPVRRISGFVYQHAPWNERPRLMIIDGLRLCLIRPQKDGGTPADSLAAPAEPSAAGVNATDSTMRQKTLRMKHLRDSLHRAERQEQPHFKE